jgi:AcrR family transcriptional regulator
MGKGAATREMILTRAADLFSRRGYAGASVTDLMRETGLGKGGIYHHFADKDALALAAFDHAVALLWARLAREMDDAPTAVGQLRGLIRAFRSLITDPLLTGGCPLLNTAVEADDAYPALRRRARQAMTQLRARIQAAVEHGVAAGELRADVQGDALATVLIAMLEGAVMLSKLYRDPVHLRRAAEHLTWYLDSLVLREGPGNTRRSALP